MIDSSALLEIELGGCVGGDLLPPLHLPITTTRTPNDVNDHFLFSDNDLALSCFDTTEHFAQSHVHEETVFPVWNAAPTALG